MDAKSGNAQKTQNKVKGQLSANSCTYGTTQRYWGEELAKLGFGLNQIRTLVSMATDSSFIFDRFFFMLAANEYNHKISNWFEIWHDTTRN